MEWTGIIKELGGGLPAVVIVALAFWVWTRERRINELTDKIIEQNTDSLSALHRLTTAIREGRSIDG